MASLTQTADSSYGRISGENATFSTARSTATASGTTDGFCGITLGNYVISRHLLRFDTSALQDGATVSSLTFSGSISADNSTTDLDIGITQYDWTSPVTTSDTDYDGALAAGVASNVVWRNTSGISTNTAYVSPELPVGWVNKTGFTYLALLSKTHDILNSAPASSARVTFNLYDNADAALRPKIIVVYTVMAGTATITGAMTGVLAANQYPVFASNVPKTTFRTKA